MAGWQCMCFLVFLIALVSVREAAGSPDDQCKFVFKKDTVLDVDRSQKNGAKVTGDLHVSDKIKCAEECCAADGEWCTLAVFHSKAAEGGLNCFLVQCVPDGGIDSVCVTKHLRHSGFISAEVAHLHNASSPSVDLNVSETPLISTLLTPSPTTANQDIHVPGHNTPPAENSKTTPSAQSTSPGGKVTNQKAESTDHSSAQPMETAPETERTNQTEDNNSTELITPSLQNSTKHSNEVHHDIHVGMQRQTVAQTGILIVTLCLGIIFLLAMLVVVGKRWCEGYQRRKYSKVDYLINGIYS